MESVSIDPNEKQSGDVNLQFIGLDVREWRSHHANTELRVLRLFAPRKRLLPLSKKLPDGERRLVCLFARSDPESGREVAFGVNGDYLILATREDLLAGALQLMAGSKDRTIEAEQWWSQAVAAAGSVGDLRMVLNLEKIVPSPYFRSYWIQRNITDMGQYSAAVSDVFRSGKEYREERVLLKKSAAAISATTGDGSTAVADLLRLLPADTGTYEVRAAPSAADCRISKRDDGVF
jgi:hypothetical protein